jgi:hypothetical protein
MSQKSSVPQAAKSVSQALMSDTIVTAIMTAVIVCIAELKAMTGMKVRSDAAQLLFGGTMARFEKSGVVATR